MEWNDIVLETEEVQGGQNNFECLAGKQFGVSGLDGNCGMEQNNVSLTSNDKRRMMLFKRKRKVKGSRVQE
jgi:hypothetical protein